MANTLDFEESLPEINRIISINIGKWKLQGAIPSISKEDIEQELRMRLWNKWHLYDPDKGPLPQWLSTVCSNAIKTHLRNHYYKFSSPCAGCPANLTGGQCKLFGQTESLNCKIYKNWVAEKKTQCDINLPVALDHHTQEVSEKPWDESNIFEELEELKDKLREKLNYNEFYIFNAIYLEDKTDLEIINDLKFSSRAQGMRAIKQLKDMIVDLVKSILIEEEMI